MKKVIKSTAANPMLKFPIVFKKLFKKEGFKEGAEPAEPVNDIQQLKDTISELDKRLTKIEKDISDFADT